MKYQQLPEAEFLVMQTIWDQEPPVSSRRVAELLDPVKGWKLQTVYTLLNRLVEKGFLTSKKQGWERFYTPVVERDSYLRQETGRFLKEFHKNSLKGFMSALVYSEGVDRNDLSELSEWLDSLEKEEVDDV